MRRVPPRWTGTTPARMVACWPSAYRKTGTRRVFSTCSSRTRDGTCPTGSPGCGPPPSPGSRTARAFTTPAIPRRRKCPRERSSTIVRSTSIGSAPTRQPIRLVFKPAEKEYWPGVSLSPDGRWLIVSVARTFDQVDLYLQDLASGAELVPVARDLPASFEGEIAHGRLFMRTNLDAPTYRLYVGGSRATRAQRLARDCAAEGRCRTGERRGSGRPAGPRLPRASILPSAAHRLSTAVSFRTSRSPPWGASSGWAPSGTGASCSTVSHPTPCLPAVYRIDLATGDFLALAAGRGDHRSHQIRGRAGELSLQGRHPDLDVSGASARAWCADGDNPTYLTGYGGFNISMTPAFSRSLLLWLEHGGVVASPQHPWWRRVW